MADVGRVLPVCATSDAPSLVRLKAAFVCDYILLGGGNAKHLDVKLPPHVQVTPNVAGLLGGIALCPLSNFAAIPMRTP